MKKCVRGQRGRKLYLGILCLVMLPLVLFAANAQARASAGGKQSILILPVTNTADGAPYKLSGQFQSKLETALSQQPGVQVDVLERTSRLLSWGKAKLDEAGKASLMQTYATATDPTASADDRLKASTSLLDALQVDAIIYADLTRYEVTTKPMVTHVRFAATMVTLEQDENGKPKVVDGNLVPKRRPFTALGRSDQEPGGGTIAQDIMDDEAVTSAVNDLSTQLSAAQNIGEGQAKSGSSDSATATPHKKKSSLGLIIAVLGAVLIAVVVGGGGGSKSSSP